MVPTYGLDAPRMAFVVKQGRLQMHLRIPLFSLTFFLGLLAAEAASAASASAIDLTADFTTDGIGTSIDPVNELDSGASSTYDKTKSIKSYSKVLVLTADGGSPPALTIDTLAERSHIKGGFGLDTDSAAAAASVASINLKLAPYTPPNSGVIAAPYLQITATKISETANYDLIAIVPSRTTVSSVGMIDTLTITGPLVGGKTLKFSGSPKENTILYQSPTVTITLNQKITDALISCSPRCISSLYNANAAAIDVRLNNAKLGARKVSGNISIAPDMVGRSLGN
jgi:hypothetical protein